MKTKIIFTKLALILLISILLPSLSQGQLHQPQLQISFTKSPPVIDGKLNDATWQGSTELSEFVNWSLDSYVKDAVTVFLCYDEKNLYVAFRNSDPAAEKLNTIVNSKRPRDTFMWGRNFAMIGIGHKDISLQFQGDPKETMADWKNNDLSWNGNWQYGASINQADWTSEFSIPLSELELTLPGLNEKLTISLSRSFEQGESAQWKGVCSLSGPSSVSSQFGKWASPVPGKNLLAFNARNVSKGNLELQCELEIIPIHDKPEFINQVGQSSSSDVQIKVGDTKPLYIKTSYTIPAGGTIAEKIPFELPVEGSYYTSASVKLKDGTIIRQSVDYWFTIEPNRKKLQDLKERLGESIGSMTRLSNPVVNSLQTEAERILSSIQQLESSADTVWRTGNWNDLTAQVEKTDSEVARHLHKVRWTALHNWKSEDDFGIALTHSIIKLRKEALFPQPITDQVDLSLARNEYESFQLAILPFGKNLNQLILEISDLKEKNGSTIQKNNIEISLVDYNKIDWQAAYVTANKGWHPDPLIPIKAGITIGGNEVCRPIWITVYAPSGTKPGEYTGTITVGAKGLKKVTMFIKCRVWDFDLPVASHLKTHSWDEITYLSDFYNLNEYPVEWYQRFCGLLLKNRFNPGSAGVNYVSPLPNSSGEYDFSKVEKVLSFCIERGLNRFSIMQMKKGIYTPEEAEQAYKFAGAYAKFLRQKGWLDKALIELWDEPTDLEWPFIKERAEKLKQIDPGLRLQLFAEHGPYDFWNKNTDQYGLNKLIDIWAPINSVESPEAQANGKEIWAYFCTLARGSAPNFYIDRPAIYQRSIAWYSWMYGLDGFEYFGSNYSWRNLYKDKPMNQKWPNLPWDSRTYHYLNGEGQLVYPGPDGVPYSSIRLENFRDGMEDYEYLFRLRELLSKFGNDNSSQINEYRQLLNPEDYLLYKYPRKIKLTLENTLRYPDQPERILDTRQKIAKAIEQLQKGIPGK